MPIKIAGYARNRPKLVRFNDTIVITARILASTFQLDLICCWSVWRYIIIIIRCRCTCNSYSLILKYDSINRLVLNEQESFCISNTIPSFKLFFIYLMPKNVDWIHILYIQRWGSRSSCPPTGLFPSRTSLLMEISVGCYLAARACAFEHRIAGWIL